MKVVFVGDSAVGKTSIILKILRNTTDKLRPTINFDKYDVTVKSSSGQEVKLCLWDTAGQETYQALAPIHARDSKAQILVFSVTEDVTFANLPNWREILEEANSLNCVFIVGNKTDLPAEDRKVTFDEAMEYASQINAKYVEVSAKTGYGINELFEQVATELLKINEDNKVTQEETVDINQKDEEEDKGNKKSDCC